MTMKHDFKGIGFSKIGYFKEVRSKIKELEKLNIKLVRRHNRLEAIFNSMTDGLTILDREMNIVFANKVQQTLFPEISLIGKKCHAAYYRRQEICRDCPALKTMNAQETLRGEVLIKGGEYAGRYYEWSTSPIHDPFGKVEEVILLMRDITARKEYEFKLMQADRMAAIGFLAAGIAHEINNPLTSVAGFSEALLNRLSKIEGFQDNKMLAPFQEYLEIINNEAYRCRDIIRNLQEFSRSSTDDYETLPIDQIINGTISLFRQHAKDSNIKIIFKNDLTAGFNRIIGKESQLKHVFLNLFYNAFKAMEHGGELSVKARNDENRIEILISDTGSGHSQKLAKNIFNVSPMDEPGTNIDLSICYSIIQHHKGEIRYDSIEGKGAVFTLRFPVALS